MEKPDGSPNIKSLEVGVQIPRSIHPQVPPEESLQAYFPRISFDTFALFYGELILKYCCGQSITEPI